MVELTPDIFATVRFLPSDHGGRQAPIMSSTFGCIFEHGDEANDCRLLLEGKGDIWPGQQVSVPIKFLYFKSVRPRLQVGDHFRLSEGKVIAYGTVDEIAFE